MAQRRTLPTGQQVGEQLPASSPAPLTLPPQEGLGAASRRVKAERDAAAAGLLPSRRIGSQDPLGLVAAIVRLLERD